MDSINFPKLNPPKQLIPLYEGRIPAGFPSPAADYVQRRIDLNERLVHDKVATFFIRASGDSMRDAGIQDGSILVVNSARPPMSGDIVVASVDGKHTVKRLVRVADRFELHPDNASGVYPVITVEHELNIFGVVTSVITEYVRLTARK